MLRQLLFIAATAALFGCGHKPKAVSNDITKTTIADSGRKDSVINNTQKNYGTATVSAPCVKCLLGVIKKSGSYQKTAVSIADDSLMYTVNWVKASTPYHIENGGKITNGLQVDITQKHQEGEKQLSSFLYDNEKARLYVINAKNNYEEDPLKIDSLSLKKIRNACYWGVASH